MLVDDGRDAGNVEVFSLGLVHAEHLKCRACIAGINFLHVWIFSENFIQLFTVDVLDSAAERDCFFIFRRRNCHIALLHELCVKGFSFCRQKIHSFLLLILRDLLLHGTMRFGELKKSIGHVSQKVLTSQLRQMEQSGLVNRKVYAEVPPRVEYSLTELGFSLRPIMDAMWDWGEAYKKKLAQEEDAAANA